MIYNLKSKARRFALIVIWCFVSMLSIGHAQDLPIDLPTVMDAAGLSSEELESIIAQAMEQLEGLNDTDRLAVENRLQELAALMPDEAVNDAMPEPATLAQGEFANADFFHRGSGKATFYELADESRILRFEDFSVTNGPGLHVILSSNSNPTGRGNIGDDYIDLGSLKGNKGNQNYDIPADIDLDQVKSIVIYCKPFHVVFSKATLSQ